MAFLDMLADLPERCLREGTRVQVGVPAEADAADELLLPQERLGVGVQRLLDMLSPLDPGMPRREWIRVMCGAHHEFHDTPEEQAALDVFDAWSSRGANYGGRDDVERNWASLRSDPAAHQVTLRTVLKLAKERGYSLPPIYSGEWEERIRIETMAEAARAEPPPWLVHELIAEGTTNLLVGAPANGKTLVGLYLGICVAAGIDFAGRQVRRGPVLYCVSEDLGSSRRRLAGLRCDHGDVEGFHIVSAKAGVFDLRSRDTEDAQALLAACQHHRPVLVVVDTFAAATPGINENDGADIGKAYAVFGALAARGITVLVLHHPKKLGQDDARGHGSQLANVATALSVKKDENGITYLSVVKARDASTDQAFAFRIETRKIGLDEQGRDVLAAVAVAADLSDARRGREKESDVSRARDVLVPLVSARGGLITADAVSACMEAAVSRAPQVDSRRKAVHRAIDRLIRERVLRRDGDRIYAAHQLTDSEADDVFDDLDAGEGL